MVRLPCKRDTRIVAIAYISLNTFISNTVIMLSLAPLENLEWESRMEGIHLGQGREILHTEMSPAVLKSGKA